MGIVLATSFSIPGEVLRGLHTELADGLWPLSVLDVFSSVRKKTNLKKNKRHSTPSQSQQPFTVHKKKKKDTYRKYIFPI